MDFGMFDQTKKSSHVHNISKFMSLKNDAVVRTMSMLEFDMCFHLEYSPEIQSYTSQPNGFYYEFNNRKCRYTPDFNIVNSNGDETFIEVKHSSKIYDPDFRRRFASKQQFSLEQLNKKLILITEKQIRINPILNNLKLLHRYSGLQTISDIQYAILDVVRDSEKIRLHDISMVLGITESEALSGTLSWLSQGKIQADLKSGEISLETHVWC